MKQFILALASAALLLAACTTESGKPFEQLPAVEEDAVWSFFAALPAADLPAEVGNAEQRQAYKTRFFEMMDGVLGDGEGPEDPAKATEKSIYWSDYFTKPEDYDWTQEPEDTPHPYANFHVYPGTAEGTLFGILESGAYVDGEDQKKPVHAYWYDGSKVKPGKIVVEPMYNADNLVPDPLLVYGRNDLHFSLKDGKFGPTYFDRGFDVYIEDVGPSGVVYEWDGVRFNRVENPVHRCIYNYGFANMMLEDDVPWSVPGDSTDVVDESNPFDRIYKLTEKGKDEPTLIFHATDKFKLSEIEVCSEKYSNPYGLHPGSTVADLLKVREEVNSLWGEDTYLSVVEQENGMVHIYAGFDEDFIYMVPKESWLGGENFKADARIARIAVINSMG